MHVYVHVHTLTEAHRLSSSMQANLPLTGQQLQATPQLRVLRVLRVLHGCSMGALGTLAFFAAAPWWGHNVYRATLEVVWLCKTS